jgi:hypothetical protein
MGVLAFLLTTMVAMTVALPSLPRESQLLKRQGCLTCLVNEFLAEVANFPVVCELYGCPLPVSDLKFYINRLR